ncbi:hypothetical protein H6F89_04110 [Cyanobacteria bacterium FACHB-63]|nr:hypothetical protein [Cyanobacteria bacterium FACHB-63]
MDSPTLVELMTVAFELNRSLLHLKLAQTDCTLAELELHLAKQSGQLAITQYQQAQTVLALTRSQSLPFNSNSSANKITP